VPKGSSIHSAAAATCGVAALVLDSGADVPATVQKLLKESPPAHVTNLSEQEAATNEIREQAESPYGCAHALAVEFTNRCVRVHVGDYIVV